MPGGYSDMPVEPDPSEEAQHPKAKDPSLDLEAQEAARIGTDSTGTGSQLRQRLGVLETWQPGFTGEEQPQNWSTNQRPRADVSELAGGRPAPQSTEPTSPPPNPQPVVGGGRGGRASLDVWGATGLGPDFNEQIDAAERAKLGRQTLADYEAGQEGE